MTSKWWAFILLIVMTSIGLDAQQLKKNHRIDTLKVPPASITLGSSFVSKVAYWGWDFGMDQYGLSPYLMICPGKGLYLYAVSFHWSAVSQGFAETDVGVGYETQFKKLYVYAAYERWFVHYGDGYNRYLLRNYLTANLAHEFDWFNAEIIHHYMWGMADAFVTDIAVNGEYTLFQSEKANYLVALVPQLTISFGSRSFWPLFSEYVEESPLKMINYEAKAAVNIILEHLEGNLSTHYSFPVNPVNQVVRPFFYFTLDLNYTFFF